MKRKASIETHKISSINTVDLSPMPELVERSRQLVRLFTTHDQLSFVLEDLQPIRLLRVRKKLFWLDHYFFFIELQRALPELELTFDVIDAGNSLKVSDITSMVRHQIEMESLTATNPKRAYAWSSFHGTKNTLLRQCDYARVLNCTTSSLKKARKRQQERKLTNSTQPVTHLDTNSLLMHVPALRATEGDEND